MQVDYILFGYIQLIGSISSLALFVILGLAWEKYRKITWVAPAYSFASLICFYLGIIVVLGAETIGTFGGYLLMILACIQIIYEQKLRQKQS